MRLTFTESSHFFRAILLWVVFFIFLLNALGVLHFSIFEVTGLQFHSNLLADLLRHGNLPPALQRADFLVFVLCGVVLCLLLPQASPITASAITFASMIVAFYVAYQNAARFGVVPLEFTLLTILILFSINVLFGYFIETHQKQRIIGIFGQYVPPAVVDTIASQPEKLNLGGEARELSVMFCDIKDFSSMSEQLSPADLAELLNTYFTEMTDVLREHGATIDKYIGDAIMAFWGAPIARADHANDALNAGIAMINHLPKLRTIFEQRGWPYLDIGVGINTGIMNVGNMGSRYRLAYTVIGDAVNLAARYEALTRLYGTQVIVGEATRMANPAINFRELDHVRVKGKGMATRLYEPIVDEMFSAEHLAEHKRALNAYYAADWQNAEQGFANLQAQTPDQTYYSLMRERIRLQQLTPNLNFDGITSFTR